MKSLTLEVRGLFEELDHLAVERHLSALDGVHRAEANPASASVTVQYDETAVGEEELRNTVEACGFHCAGERVPNHVCHADHQMSGAVFLLLVDSRCPCQQAIPDAEFF